MEFMGFAEMNGVEFPEMRAAVIDAVKALADEEYQRRVWVHKVYPKEGYYDDFSMNVNLLFDDTLVLDGPDRHLGTILATQAEVEAMESLGSSLLELLDAQGRDKSDLEYIEAPEWNSVVVAARRAYERLVRSD